MARAKKNKEVKGQTELNFEVTSEEKKEEKRGRGRPAKDVKALKQSFFIEPEADITLSFVSANFGMTKSRFINRLSETLLKDILNAIALEERGAVQDKSMNKEKARRLLSMLENYGFEKVEVEERDKIIHTNTKRKNTVRKAQSAHEEN